MNMIKKFGIGLATVAVLGGGAVGAMYFGLVAFVEPGPAQAAASDPRQNPLLVQVALARPAGATERSFTGTVSARVQSSLGFRVPGKVLERFIDVGQNVKAGQPLMRIDAKDFDLARTAQENAVASARALAVQAAADEVRYEKLLKDGWATRQKYDSAKAAVDSANAQLAAAQAQAEVATNQAGYSLLLADADGTIVETLAEPGQVVTAGQTVVRLAHAGPREATVNLPETMRPLIGAPAKATLYGQTTLTSPARLRQLSNAADPASRTYEARYVLEGAAASAPLGATITIAVATTEGGDAAEIPLGALHDTGTATGVWIVDSAKSTVAFRPVQVSRLADETAIVHGVAAGEPIVALGAHLLHAGAPIRVAKDQMAVQ